MWNLHRFCLWASIAINDISCPAWILDTMDIQYMRHTLYTKGLSGTQNVVSAYGCIFKKKQQQTFSEIQVNIAYILATFNFKR